jgi:tungstate transport system ATP-binding protein
VKNLIEIQNLVVKRETQTVLEIDEITIREGEVLAVIGPNGAGKSTFMLALARLLKPANGRITFHGEPFETIEELTYRRKIGLVLQEPLLMDTTVYNNVATGLRFRGLAKDEIRERVVTWLERLGIAHLAKRPARKLSGGEAQRASLARSFALQPELLLLDEPFSALDAPTRARLQEDLQALLKTTVITTVLITHDLDEALLLGQRVAVLIEGQLRQIGTPEEVFSAPKDELVAAFVGVETIIPGKIIGSSEGGVIIAHQDHLLEAVSVLPVGREVFFCLRPEDVTLWPQESAPASSARNRMAGNIEAIYPQGALMRVVVNCGFPLMALVTRASAREMSLEEGHRWQLPSKPARYI